MIAVVPQIAFIAPGNLWWLLVIPALIIAYVFATRRKNRRGMRFTNTSMLDVVVPKQSQWRRHLAVALSLLSLVTLTTAFARPKMVVDVPRERATVVIVLDASLSMQATDVKPTRLDAAKAAAIEFVQKLPEKYNVSIVSMAGNSSILVPPTLAHNTVENAITSIRLQDSTAIGEGIYTALRALQQAPRGDNPDDVAPGAIVMLTDGTNTVGRSPQQAATAARNAKVPIYTIAYGTENGYVDLDGKRRAGAGGSRPDEDRRPDQQRPVLRRRHRRPAEDGVRQHRLRGGVREGGPGGHLTVRGLRAGLRGAGRAGGDLPRSEVALMTLLAFLEPNRLWLLLIIPALVGTYLALVRRRRVRRQTMGRTMFDLVIPRDRTWVRHVAVGLSILSLATLTMAFAKPKDQVSVPRERATVVVTIDVSLSMEAEDVEPNRLEAAKSAAEAFVTSLPPKFNVSLVSFAGTATTLVPPTLDRGAVTAAIQALQPQPSTAIGEGIYTSLAALSQVPPDPSDPQASVPARIVLLSDGKTQVGRPSDRAAREAKDRQVPIYTIAYGTDDGYIEVNGRREPVPVDRAELKRVSTISGGEAYTATSAGQLKDVYRDIGTSVGTEKVDQEVTGRWAGFGLGFAILAALGMISLGARWP